MHINASHEQRVNNLKLYKIAKKCINIKILKASLIVIVNEDCIIIDFYFITNKKLYSHIFSLLKS
jgi:hypothetical protein